MSTPERGQPNFGELRTNGHNQLDRLEALYLTVSHVDGKLIGSPVRSRLGSRRPLVGPSRCASGTVDMIASIQRGRPMRHAC